MKKSGLIKDILFSVIVILLALLILMAVKTFFTVNYFEQYCDKNLKEIGNSLKEQSDDIVSVIKKYMNDRSNIGKEVAQVYDGFDFNTIDLTNNQTKAAENARLDRIALAADCKDLFIVDPHGKVILSTDRNAEGKNYKKYEEEHSDLVSFGNILNNSQGFGIYVANSDVDIAASAINICDLSLTFGNMDKTGTVFSFAVDKADGSFVFFEKDEKSLTGESAFAHGLTKKAMSEGFKGFIKIDGHDYYALSAAVDTYAFESMQIFICTEVFSTLEVGAFLWIALLILLSAFLISVYGIILKGKVHTKSQIVKRLSLMAVSLLIVTTLGTSFFQSLFCISEAIDNAEFNEARIAEKSQEEIVVSGGPIATHIQNMQTEAKVLGLYVEEHEDILMADAPERPYLSDSHSHVKDLYGNNQIAYANVPELKEIAEDYGIDQISVFNEKGYTIFSSGDIWYEQLNADDKEVFEVLDFKKEVGFISDTDSSGNTVMLYPAHMYLYTYSDADGHTRYADSRAYEKQSEAGYTGPQIDRHNAVLVTRYSGMSSLLTSQDFRMRYIIKVSELIGNSTIHIFDNDQTAESGSLADTSGILTNNRFATVNDVRSFIHTGKIPSMNKVVESIVTTDNLYIGREETVTAAFVLSLFLFATLILYYSSRKRLSTTETADQLHFRIHFSRSNGYIPFKERNPEQKINVFVRYAILLFLIIFGCILLCIRRKPSLNSALAYILSGNFDRGFTYFSLISCGLLAFAVFIVTMMIGKIGEFILYIMKDYRADKIRLIMTLIKMIMGAAGILACLYFLGLDVKGLFASAGIMAAIVGFGSKELVGDIMSGVTNVIADKYRIGETIKVGERVSEFTGKIVEINLRSVKLIDEQGKTKIISNSGLNSVVNLSRNMLGACVAISVPGTSDIDFLVEEIQKRLPKMSAECNLLYEEIHYIGVTRFENDNVFLGFAAKCSDADREYCNWYIYKNVKETIDELIKVPE